MWYGIPIYGLTETGNSIGPCNSLEELMLEFYLTQISTRDFNADDDGFAIIEMTGQKITDSDILTPDLFTIDKIVNELKEINATDDKDLPTLLEDIETDEGKLYLERKLK